MEWLKITNKQKRHKTIWNSNLAKCNNHSKKNYNHKRLYCLVSFGVCICVNACVCLVEMSTEVAEEIMVSLNPWFRNCVLWWIQRGTAGFPDGLFFLALPGTIIIIRSKMVMPMRARRSHRERRAPSHQ